MSDEKPDKEKRKFDMGLEGLMRGIPGMATYEPSSDDRENAAQRWSEYQAYKLVGFTVEEALELIMNAQSSVIDALIHYHFPSGESDD